MSFKKWIAIFISAIIAVGALTAGFNALVDPFGIFGDVIFDWYSYNMTQNPRISKIAYLDRHHGKYDSYIIGCSKTGSYSTEALNKYYGGASFYNMLMYGGDMYDIEMTARYILDNYSPKNIIVSMGLEETVKYDTEADNMKANLHAKVDGSPLLLFYGKYLFSNPSYAIDKIAARFSDGYLVNENDVFIPETGVYDKAVRDVERIGGLDQYLETYPSFRTVLKKVTLDAMDDCLGSIRRIKSLCDEKGVSFMMIISPIYHTEMDMYDKAQLWEFHTRLSQITPYWDFSGYNPVSFEPRYFYDPYHFRNAVGDMALARIFGDDSKYVPEDFGRYVDTENVGSHLAEYFGSADGSAAENVNNAGQAAGPADMKSYSANVPILMYHHIDDEVTNSSVVTPGRFEEHLAALKEAGFSTITLHQMASYVENGEELPENPVVITFDDGYRSNYELAYPLLKKYGMAATINVIGVSMGADTYKDTGVPITHHFNFDEAREMMKSGLIDIQSHSYDMHNSETLDSDYRQGVYMKTGESEGEYIAAFRSDFERSRKEIEANTNSKVIAYAYPNGFYTTLSEVLLSEMGVKITLTVEEGMNTVIKGLPQSLRAMKRYRVAEDISGSELVDRIRSDNRE
ncbi:MAG: polysaccharide deacetylase family protein [Clostridiaceae bacterium]|jgi:peptidoglycan/xylan/chitin deacetylase (PgdA/CDA1 family)|nr:polysaccharide deacetylase family protein [Clostridiaceae bacterium]